jgi:stalled ribosome rescue protein Dom34
MTWKELRKAILDAHKPIKDLFFTGLGNKLQFIDSTIAENIMMQFAKMDYPALPIHDSFIMHHAFGNHGELEEAMRRAFYDKFHRDIGVSRELVVRQEVKKTSNKTPKVTEGLEELLDAESDYSLWKIRDDMWMRRK